MRTPRLESRQARRSIPPRHEPYWRQIEPGLAVGYRNGVWYARYHKDGRYRKERLGKADDLHDANGKDVLSFQQAQRLAIKSADRRASEPAKKRLKAHYTVADAIEDYLEWYGAHRKAVDKTRAAAEARILPKLGKRPISELTARELRRWHEAIATSKAKARSAVVQRYRPVDESKPEENRRRRQATANRLLTILKAALNHAFRDGQVESDLEWRRVKAFRGVDVPKIRYLAEEECRRLLNACPSDFRAVVHGALSSGCRWGELRRMQCSDFNPDSGTLLVRESKGGKPRHIPLTDEGAALAEELTAGRPGDTPLFARADGKAWGSTEQARRMKEACKIAHIEPPIGINELRHTYASLLVMRGVPLEVIAECLGHSDTRMTKRHYAHLAPGHVAEVIRQKLPRFSDEPRKVKRLKR